jgi:hypothetical protein
VTKDIKSPIGPSRKSYDYATGDISQKQVPRQAQRFSVSKKEVEHANQGQVPSDRYGPREV